MQKAKLRILILEDNPLDAELMEDALREAGIVFASQRVETRESFLGALDGFSPDLILSDHDLPRFNGTRALELAKERCPDVPFILVTGAIDEKRAVEILKKGATDYIMKGNLSRLVPAVERALNEARERKLRAFHAVVAESRIETLRESECRYRHIVEDGTELIARIAFGGTITFVNDAACRFAGLDRGELIGRNYLGYVPKEDHERLKKLVQSFTPGHPVREIEQRVVLPGRETRWLLVAVQAIYWDGRLSEFQIMGRDITDRKEVVREIIAAKERWERTFDAVPDLIAILDARFRIVQANRAMAEKLGLRADECVGRICYQAIHGTDQPPSFCPHTQSLMDGREHVTEVYEKNLGGDFIVSTSPFFDAEGRTAGCVHMARDITDRKRAEETLRRSFQDLKDLQEKLETKVRERTALLAGTNKALMVEIEERRRMAEELRKSEETYRLLFELNLAGVVRVSVDPESLRGELTDCNDAFAAILGYPSREERLKADVKDIFPEKTLWTGFVNRLIKYKKLINHEMCLLDRRGHPVWVILNLRLQKPKGSDRMLIEGTMVDITLRKRVEEQMRAANKKLRAMTSEMILKEEQDRQQIATVLHDTVAQTLAAVKMKCESIHDHVDRSGLQLMEEARTLVAQAIRQTRSVMAELSPPILYELGFIPALEWLAEQIGDKHGIPVRFDCSDQFKPMDHDIQILLFQATRELLTNIAKHARATEALVRVSGNNGKVVIEVSDNGRGFDKTRAGYPVNLSRGFGLFSIRERLKHFGGSIDIQSGPGEGTRISMTVGTSAVTGSKKEKKRRKFTSPS